MIITLKKINYQCKEILSLLDQHKIKYFLPKNSRDHLLVIEQKREVEAYSLLRNNNLAVSFSLNNPHPYELVSRYFHKEDASFKISDYQYNKDKFLIIAGPCSIDSEENLTNTSKCLKENNISFLRGGAFKPRTSPYEFQGLGEEGLKMLSKIKKEFNLYTVSEIVSENDISLFKDVDIIQIGARNMQNFALLKKVGSLGKIVLLKRGLASTGDEFLLAAEYLLLYGAEMVILCERGIRTFNSEMRFTLDLALSAHLKSLTYLPLIIDPSHPAGNDSIVKELLPLSLYFDGVIIEIHPHKEEALSDGKQSLSLEEFTEEINKLRKINIYGKNF